MTAPLRPEAIVLRVVDEDEVIRGTAFMIGAAGHEVLTCHHVVDGLGRFRLESVTGVSVQVSSDQILSIPEHDLALLPGSAEIGSPLPISVKGPVVGSGFITAGFHRIGSSIQSAFPVSGVVRGHATVRYESATAQYELVDALVLRDDEFSEGLSGAPVIDLETGVVIGVVSSRLLGLNGSGGFGVPLPVGSPKLADVLQANSESVCAYGEQLNPVGLRTLCRLQVSTAIEELSSNRGLDLSRRIERRSLSAGLAAMLEAGNTRFLTILGPSGVGKSTELAAAAQRANSALLLRGSALAESSRSVRDAIDTNLQTLALPTTSADVIAETAQGSLRVFVDGLNEAPLSGRPMQEWLLASERWSRSVGAALIVSSRPEFWNSVQHNLQPSTLQVLQLSEFTEQEARAAIQAYGLNVSANLSALIRVPLALRMAADLPAGDSVANATSINGVVEAYVRQTAHNVASALGAPATADTVMDWLYEAAREMLESASDDLTPHAARLIFPGALLALDHVVSENLLSRTTRGWRFVYDDVADWLQASQIQLHRQLSKSGLVELERHWQRLGPTSYALRDVERVQGDEVFRNLLLDLVREVPESGLTAITLIQETLTKCFNLERYLDVLESFADACVRSEASSLLSNKFWQALTLELPNKLALLRRLIPLDNYWRWRRGDWARYEVQDSQLYYASAVYELVAADVTVGFPALATWSEDGRLLEGGEATVADVAHGILFRLRWQAPDLMWETVAGLGEKGENLLREIAEHDPKLITTMLQKHGSSSLSPASLLMALYSLPVLPDGDEAELLEIMWSLSRDRSQPFGVHATAVELLGRYAEPEPFFKFVSEEFVAKRIPAYLVVSATQRQPERLARLLADGLVEPNSRDDTLYSARHLPTEAAQHIVDTAVLRLLTDGQSSVTPAISGYVESRLYDIGGSNSTVARLLDWILLAGSGSGRHQLVFALVGQGSRRLASDTRRSLVMRLIAGEIDPQALSLIIDRVVGDYGAEEWHEEVLLAALSRMDSEAADRALTGASLSSARFAGVLIELFESRRLVPPGSRTRAIWERDST